MRAYMLCVCVSEVCTRVCVCARAQGEMLSSGAIKALTQCVCDTTRPESVRAAAARTLSALMVDGAIAVEVGVLTHIHTDTHTHTHRAQDDS